MKEKETNNGIAIAALKLSVIQPAFNGTFPDMSKKDYYIRIAAKPLKLPDGREARYSPGTYACWESDYRKGGFDALIPKERADRGHSRKLDPDAIAKIYELHERYPKLSATGIRNRMIADGLINAADVSVTTFQRFIKKNNLKGGSAPGQKDRRAFEEEFSTGIPRVWDTSQQAISDRRAAGRGRAEIRKGYPFPMLAKKVSPTTYNTEKA